MENLKESEKETTGRNGRWLNSKGRGGADRKRRKEEEKNKQMCEMKQGRTRQDAGGLRRNLTLGSRECSGHSTWSRLQYVLL